MHERNYSGLFENPEDQVPICIGDRDVRNCDVEEIIKWTSTETFFVLLNRDYVNKVKNTLEIKIDENKIEIKGKKILKTVKKKCNRGRLTIHRNIYQISLNPKEKSLNRIVISRWFFEDCLNHIFLPEFFKRYLKTKKNDLLTGRCTGSLLIRPQRLFIKKNNKSVVWEIWITVLNSKNPDNAFFFFGDIFKNAV